MLWQLLVFSQPEMQFLGLLLLMLSQLAGSLVST
jgi:hypothetical protein